jgi:transcriptional regulator with XRE-family HTH domain
MPNLKGARAARLDLIAETGENLTVEGLAELLGRDGDGELNWSRSHLTSVENGNRPASDELISMLAHHLRTTRDHLITGAKPDRPPPQPTRKPAGPPKKQPPPSRGPARVDEEAAA